jgi:hypothetical protein
MLDSQISRGSFDFGVWKFPTPCEIGPMLTAN